MSADPDKDTAFPSLQADTVAVGSSSLVQSDTCHKVSEKKRKKPSRSVHFPDEDVLVTQYFEPANPWHDGKYPNSTIRFPRHPEKINFTSKYLVTQVKKIGSKSTFSLSSAW